MRTCQKNNSNSKKEQDRTQRNQKQRQESMKVKTTQKKGIIEKTGISTDAAMKFDKRQLNIAAKFRNAD